MAVFTAPVGALVPALIAVTAPAVAAPSAPRVSAIPSVELTSGAAVSMPVTTLPVAGSPLSSVTLSISFSAIGASSIIAMLKSLGGVTLPTPSVNIISKSSVTVSLVLSVLINVY